MLFRSIVALGFETKKIASQQEVQARAADDHDAYVAKVQEATKPSETVIHFGKNKGIPLGELTPAQLRWYAHEWKIQDEPSEYDHHLKAAALALDAGDDSEFSADPFPDVPFA